MKWLDGMCFGHMKDGEVGGLERGRRLSEILRG